MSTFRIISFDGGGVRGALSIRLLLRIIERFPELLGRVQLFTGTSTGSFIALGLANNLSPNKIDKLYSYDNAKYIFTPSHANYIRPKFSNAHLKELLSSVFSPNLTLAALPRFVFIPTFNVKGYHSKGFNTVYLNNLTSNPTLSEKVLDAALYSSAAPTYFPSYNHFIDGGVAMNSPTSAPVIFVRSLFPAKYPLRDFRLLSIGTGYYPERIEKDTSNWGVVQWTYSPNTQVKYPLNSILFDAPSELDTRYSEELLGANFFRLNPHLDRYVALDDYKQVPYLQQLADEVDLKETFNYISRHFFN